MPSTSPVEYIFYTAPQKERHQEIPQIIETENSACKYLINVYGPKAVGFSGVVFLSIPTTQTYLRTNIGQGSLGVATLESCVDSVA